MIEVLPERDPVKIKELFADKGIQFKETAGFVSAKCGEDILGFCLYYLDEKRMDILCIEPLDDLLLADGILRSTIHIACERFVMDVRYSENLDDKIFEKLGFIKNRESRSLDTDKLFGGCGCQKQV